MGSTVWILVAVAVAAWLLLGRIGKIDGARAHELVAGGARLVDVRTEAEFAAGHLDGAENVPLDRIQDRAPAFAAAARPVVVYCASGMRSASAKRALRAAGVQEVYDLGAMRRW